ncbi:MAG: 23S rRNA (uracil(1939)-C(5))-methyltransferase RlmD [Lachnospiraceae bacterium]|jgi:23S rRNA (uracil1939-C5)-methyltransferase|nr:23S rRNA (uracil(1939)-C(5))-methyltransferase RlmD [Lachnospiraceae bacterium]
MQYTKNNRLKIEIEDISSDGSGIGHVDGYTLFVKDALPGDIIDAKIIKPKKNYAFARIEEIIKPSKDRVTPRCPISKPCGGCQIQGLEYNKQLEFKENKVKNNLVRIGSVEESLVNEITLSILGMEEPFRYRNKAQFPIGEDKDGNLVAGFYAGRTHSIIPVDDCVIGSKNNKEILQIVLDFMEKNHISAYNEKLHGGLVRHVLIREGYISGEIMVCLVINGKTLPKSEKLIERLSKVTGMTSIVLNINTGNTNVILGDKIKVLWGEPYITDKIEDLTFRISPLAFYQVNQVQTEKLYNKALEFAGLTGKEIVWDIYCGIGTISLFLAKKAKKVYGIEIIPEAIVDANANARLNGISNVEFMVGDAKEVLCEEVTKFNKNTLGKDLQNSQSIENTYLDEDKSILHKENKCNKTDIFADVIVVDPPRKGLDDVTIQTMVSVAPKKIVYVSCDSATLARDIKIFRENGYELEKVQPVDMFPQTVSVETCVLLSRK